MIYNEKNNYPSINLIGNIGIEWVNNVIQLMERQTIANGFILNIISCTLHDETNVALYNYFRDTGKELYINYFSHTGSTKYLFNNADSIFVITEESRDKLDKLGFKSNLIEETANLTREIEKVRLAKEESMKIEDEDILNVSE